VSASIITTTEGSRLVLTGTETGASNAVTVTESGGDGGLSALVYDPSDTSVTSTLTQTAAAADANFTINGYAATSANNSVTGAISGVTINLLGASASTTSSTTPATTTYTPTTLTIAPDTTTATTSINNFVSALNSTLSTIATLTDYDASTETAGALQGNATLQSFGNQLSEILDTVRSSNTGINSLSDLGITADANTGTYDSSASTLSSALTGSLSAVESLLGGTNGIATKINALVTQYTQAGGILASINDGLETGLTNVTTQQTQLNAELATYSATLTTQYNAMDTAVASLKEMQTYLTAEFNANATSSSTSSLSSGTTST
jgi:flagellar hook-associated protein 2